MIRGFSLSVGSGTAVDNHLSLVGPVDAGFSLAEIDLTFDQAREASVETPDGLDVIPDLPEAPVTRLGDLWILGKHRLLCGDAREKRDCSRLLGAEKADLIFTDSPYNVEIDGNVTGPGRHSHRGSGGRSIPTIVLPIPGIINRCIPVALDLNGDGVQLTPVTSSNTYFDMAGDGYQHATAWAAPGDALLAYDANNDGKIDQQNEIDFTQWDPTATSDMQALRDVFDTNHDGKLDASDANFSQFKLIVTNADGTQTLQTLAQAGIASIDLIEDQTTRTFADGSSIDGQTVFTRTDGTTGTAATVSLVYDAAGAALRSTTTLNADGSTTIDNKSLNADGSVANERILTTSADGKTKTLSVDLDGDGVIDQIQTSVTVLNADGSKTETVTDKTAGGVNLYNSVTRAKKSRFTYLNAA